jgi:hypothetical protein
LGSQPLAKTRGDNQAALFVKGVLLRARKPGQSSVQKFLRNAPLGTTFHHYTPHDSLKARIRAVAIALPERLFELRCDSTPGQNELRTRLNQAPKGSTLPLFGDAAADRSAILQPAKSRVLRVLSVCSPLTN